MLFFLRPLRRKHELHHCSYCFPLLLRYYCFFFLAFCALFSIHLLFFFFAAPRLHGKVRRFGPPWEVSGLEEFFQEHEKPAHCIGPFWDNSGHNGDRIFVMRRRFPGVPFCCTDEYFREFFFGLRYCVGLGAHFFCLLLERYLLFLFDHSWLIFLLIH